MGSACSTDSEEKHKLLNTSRNDTESITKEQDSLPPLSNGTMSRRAPSRTISVLKQQDEDDILKRNPGIKNTLGKFERTKSFLESLQNKKDFDDYEELHKKLNDDVIEPFTDHSTNEQRLLMGDHLAKIRFHEPLFEIYRKILSDHDLLDGISPSLDDEDGDEPYYETIVDIRTILWNFSDSSKDFALAISDGTELFQWLIKDLQCTFNEGLENLSDAEYSFNSAVAIVTNCGRAGLNKSSFNVELKDSETKKHFVDVLSPFLQSKEQFVKLTTLLALSYMVNEDQNEILTADGSLIDFLLNMIKQAIEDKERRYSGFSAHELIDGLANLAKNDSNKLKIMDKKDTFPMLKQAILQKKSQEEMLAATNAVWELAFAERNKAKFAADKELMQQLEQLQKSPIKDVSNVAGRTLFVIDPSNEKNLMKPVADDTKSKLEQPEKQHIMISYQWGHQKVVLDLRDKLRESNFPVWIDVDFMEGSILQMMATAIEKASVVLICYSENYRYSKNCRTEAEYAYQKDKHVIPILLQYGYRPDGWLGILIGTKKFYDFSMYKHSFTKKFSELKNELDGIFKGNQDVIPRPIPNPSAPDTSDADKLFLLSWRKSDLENWLQQNELQAFSGLKSLSGQQIAFLYKLSFKAPDFFYKCLEEKLGLKSLEDLMKFDKALETLSRQHPEMNKLLH